MSRVIGKMCRDFDAIADRFREQKDQLGISDAALDALCGFAAGHVSKILGPGRAKGMGRLTFDTVADALGLSVVVVIDPEKVRRMKGRWEKRNAVFVNVRPCRLSKAARTQARTEIFAALGTLGGTARARNLSKERRSEIARHAAQEKHRKVREMVGAA
jgi:hypothetical protein